MTITQEQLDTIKPGTVWKGLFGSKPEATVVLITRQHLGTLESRLRSMVILRSCNGELWNLSPSLLLKHYQRLGSTKAEKKLGYMHKIVAYLEAQGISEFRLSLELLMEGKVLVNGQVTLMSKHSKLLELVRTFISHKTRISKINLLTISKTGGRYVLDAESQVEHTEPINYVGVTSHTFELTGENHA